MSRFVDLPHLPRRCDTVLYGAKYADKLRKPLDSLRIHSVFVPDNPKIEPQLAGHADLSVLHAGGERVLLAPYLKGSAVESWLSSIGAEIMLPNIEQQAAYPEDAQLNLCQVGETILYNRKTVPDSIVEYLTRNGALRFISCHQGYTRCSSCVVDRRSVITADRGVAARASAAGLSVTLISPGHITLDGFAYGFIGGAAFKISEKKIAFTGKLDAHPDCSRILQFLEQREIDAVFLTDEPIFDIGSAVPILEKE